MDKGINVNADTLSIVGGHGELENYGARINIKLWLNKVIFVTLKTIKKARELDYFIRLYYIGVNSADESIKRIKNRVEKGGHDIPEQDVKRRYNKRFEDLANILPYCNEVKLYDNENGFVEKAEYRNGELLTKNKDVPEWIKCLKQYLDNK